MTLATTHPSGTTVPRLPRRRLVQAVFFALAFLPAASSILTLTLGVDRFVNASTVDPGLDNTYRYLGGVYLGLAVLAFWSIPKVEERIDALAFVAGAVALGGLGRLISVADVGAPSSLTWYVLVIEFGASIFALTIRRSVARLDELRESP